jgi:hypothetical protein
MTDIIQHLKTHLKNDIFLPVDNNIYRFIETDVKENNEAPLEEIILSELQAPASFCLLNPQRLLKINDFLFQSNFYKRDCDFILVDLKNNSLNIYLVECKSTILAVSKDKNTGKYKTKKEDALEQIKHSCYPVEYILKLLNEHYNEEIPFDFKGLIFYTQLKKRLGKSAETSGLRLPSKEEKDFDAQDHNKDGKFPVYSKKVSGSHTIHTFDDFLSYFKTA